MTKYQPPSLPDLSDAACRDHDPELFFPEQQRDLELAQSLCRTCPALRACEGAVDARIRAAGWLGLWGVWAGVFYRDGQVTDEIRPRGRRPAGVA